MVHDVVLKSGRFRIVAFTLVMTPARPSSDGQFWPGLAVLDTAGLRVIDRVDLSTLVQDLPPGTANLGVGLVLRVTPFRGNKDDEFRLQIHKVMGGNGLSTYGKDVFYRVDPRGSLALSLVADTGNVYGKCGWCCGGGANVRWWAEDLDGDGEPELIRRRRDFTKDPVGEECREPETGTAEWVAFRAAGGTYKRLLPMPSTFRIDKRAADLGGIWPNEWMDDSPPVLPPGPRVPRVPDAKDRR